MRIVVAERTRSRPFTLGRSMLGGPDTLGGGDPRPSLITIVQSAVELVLAGEALELVDQATRVPSIDAVVWEHGAEGAPRWSAPTAFVEFADGELEPLRGLGPLIASLPGGKFPTSLRIASADLAGAVDTVAQWLADHVVKASVFTVEERRMLEVVFRSIRESLEEERLKLDPEDAAQVLGALDTADTQLRLPRPSRRVMQWALSQISGFPAGMLSGMAANYLPQLLHHFGV